MEPDKEDVEDETSDVYVERDMFFVSGNCGPGGYSAPAARKPRTDFNKR